MAVAASSSRVPALEPVASASSLGTQEQDLEANCSSEAAGGTSGRPPRKTLRRLATDNTEIQTKAAAVTAAFKRPAVWVMFFGWSLAACAGIVNAAAYHTWGFYASHMTGATTTIGLRIEGAHGAGGKAASLQGSLALVASFLAGACACGLLIDKNHVHFGGKALYGVALIGNAVLLVLAALLSDTPLTAGCCAAAACGLQNAMCTSHFGAVVRTVHVTGTLTDIGSNVGRIAMICLRKALRGAALNALERAEVAVDAKKIMLLLPMWCSFLVGGIIGAFLSARIGINTLLVPATLTFVMGMLYVTLRGWLKGKLKGLDRARLGGNVAEVVEALARTRGLLHACQQEGEGSDATGVPAGEVVEELDHEFAEMLEAVRGVEADLTRLYQRQCSLQQGGGGSAPRVPPRAGTTAF